MGQVLQQLVGILGKRSALSFGLVTFLVSALLATLGLKMRPPFKDGMRAAELSTASAS